MSFFLNMIKIFNTVGPRYNAPESNENSPSRDVDMKSLYVISCVGNNRNLHVTDTNFLFLDIRYCGVQLKVSLLCHFMM